MRSFLILVTALAAMFSIVPLAAWAARGRWQDAWEAAKGYGLVLGLTIGLPAVAGVVWGVIDSLTP